ncbi:MAG: hypothetical protein IT167_14565 [Bryobacterales bacterium]|nr:hypothetical protein [Bryobacterales bacterium]
MGDFKNIAAGRRRRQGHSAIINREVTAMRTRIRRREILALAAGAVAASAGQPRVPVSEGVPRVDYHAHPEHGMTVARAIGISKSRGVRFGLVRHAGMKESASSERLSNDTELLAWKKSLEGQPVFCGIQAEGYVRQCWLCAGAL